MAFFSKSCILLKCAELLCISFKVLKQIIKHSFFVLFFFGGGGGSGRVLDLRPRGCRFDAHRHHCFESLSKNINSSLVLVQHRKTCPFITERLLMGRKESNQANKIKHSFDSDGLSHTY